MGEVPLQGGPFVTLQVAGGVSQVGFRHKWTTLRLSGLLANVDAHFPQDPTVPLAHA